MHWDAEGSLGCVPWPHLANPYPRTNRLDPPRGTRFWELLVWKVGRGVEDIAESGGQGGK